MASSSEPSAHSGPGVYGTRTSASRSCGCSPSEGAPSRPSGSRSATRPSRRRTSRRPGSTRSSSTCTRAPAGRRSGVRSRSSRTTSDTAPRGRGQRSPKQSGTRPSARCSRSPSCSDRSDSVRWTCTRRSRPPRPGAGRAGEPALHRGGPADPPAVHRVDRRRRGGARPRAVLTPDGPPGDGRRAGAARHHRGGRLPAPPGARLRATPTDARDRRGRPQRETPFRAPRRTHRGVGVNSDQRRGVADSARHRAVASPRVRWDGPPPAVTPRG